MGRLPFIFLFLTIVAPILYADNTGALIRSCSSVNPKSKIENQKSGLPSAAEILAQARAALPDEPLLIKGQIWTGGRIGKLERACHLEIFMELGEDPAVICCRLSDAFGTPFEKMTVTAWEDQPAEFEYETGAPLRRAAAPPAAATVLGTDLAWNDLSLLFLWRRDGRTLRMENLRGRDCYVIEFPGQAGASIENKKIIWIDAQIAVLLQMDDLDRNGELLRRMTVKNIKKISDQWMVKNTEIRAYPSLHHTQIRIDEVDSGLPSTAGGQ